MDTIEQVLSLPSHSEVLLLCHMSPPRRACPYRVRPGHAVRTGPASSHPSPLSGPFLRGGVGVKNTQSLNLSFPSSALIMTPPHTLFFFFYSFFSLGLVLLLPFLHLPNPSSFFVLKYNQECGKLEGDPVLCPSQGSGGRNTRGSRQASPRVPGADLVESWAFQLPRVPGLRQWGPRRHTARLHLGVKRKHFCQ